VQACGWSMGGAMLAQSPPDICGASSREKEFTMKKLAAAALAAIVVSSIVAPAFAQTVKNCAFKDQVLCKVETLSNTKED